MSKKDYTAEHKRLIGILEAAGQEGERQKKEVEGGCCGGMMRTPPNQPIRQVTPPRIRPAYFQLAAHEGQSDDPDRPIGRTQEELVRGVTTKLEAHKDEEAVKGLMKLQKAKGKGKTKTLSLEEALLAHFNMGHNFEVLKEKETPARVTFNIAQHGVNWKPSKVVADQLNKEFQTFHFTTTGRMYAKRGREFARDAEIITKRLKEYEVNQTPPPPEVGGSKDLRKIVLTNNLRLRPEAEAHRPIYEISVLRHHQAVADEKEKSQEIRRDMGRREPVVRTAPVVRPKGRGRKGGKTAPAFFDDPGVLDLLEHVREVDQPVPTRLNQLDMNGNHMIDGERYWAIGRTDRQVWLIPQNHPMSYTWLHQCSLDPTLDKTNAYSVTFVNPQ